MRRKSLRDLARQEMAGRRALVRVDYNVPLDEAGGVADAARIEASLPTLRLLLEVDARPVLLSHLGRPKGHLVPALSLAPLAPVLEALLGAPVVFVPETDTPGARTASRDLSVGEVLLLENTRFLPGETVDDPGLATRLAELGDLYVNDAFGSCHRAHASVVGVPRLLRPAVAGLLVERELVALGVVREARKRPFVVVLGGAKIADKIGLLEVFLGAADALLIGGAMANTFLAASGCRMGESLVEDEALDTAGALLDRAGDKLRLPADLVVAPGGAEDAREARVVEGRNVPEGMAALDVGPRTSAEFGAVVAEGATVFWNGPLGRFERRGFEAGTEALARAVARATQRGAFTVIGGGDSASAIRRAGLAGAVSHVSTGGGASLEYLASGSLPGIDALETVR